MQKYLLGILVTFSMLMSVLIFSNPIRKLIMLPSTEHPDTECVVCYELFQDVTQNQKQVFACTHNDKFCTDCVEDFLTRKEKNLQSCPYCRARKSDESDSLLCSGIMLCCSCIFLPAKKIATLLLSLER